MYIVTLALMCLRPPDEYKSNIHSRLEALFWFPQTLEKNTWHVSSYMLHCVYQLVANCV